MIESPWLCQGRRQRGDSAELHLPQAAHQLAAESLAVSLDFQNKTKTKPHTEKSSSQTLTTSFMNMLQAEGPLPLKKQHVCSPAALEAAGPSEFLFLHSGSLRPGSAQSTMMHPWFMSACCHSCPSFTAVSFHTHTCTKYRHIPKCCN